MSIVSTLKEIFWDRPYQARKRANEKITEAKAQDYDGEDAADTYRTAVRFASGDRNGLNGYGLLLGMGALMILSAAAILLLLFPPAAGLLAVALATVGGLGFWGWVGAAAGIAVVGLAVICSSAYRLDRFERQLIEGYEKAPQSTTNPVFNRSDDNTPPSIPTNISVVNMADCRASGVKQVQGPVHVRRDRVLSSSIVNLFGDKEPQGYQPGPNEVDLTGNCYTKPTGRTSPLA